MTSARLLRHALLASFLALQLVTAGCGSTKTVVAPARDVTLGQELTDLDEAYKNGVITKREYESAKKRLLEGR